MSVLMAPWVGHWPSWVKAACWLAPLGLGAYLGWSEWALRKALVPPAEVSRAAAVAPPLAQVNPAAIATVMGLGSEVEALRSAEPLTLRASFVSSSGLSRALLADADGERIYQVGERLPGGSVLRRVEARHVLLWRQGREELLPLQLAGERTLQPAVAQGAGPAPLRPSFLRPAAEPFQSD
ncbi:protein XcpP [Pseudomonas sp. GD03860]|uniref:type II secretion system protein N n=1 Tax=Pseudomonas TaxID=286 RepID=UPI0023633806|nr:MULTISPECIES: type II secretion system protein N [Pseudomonas]MDD2058614.1 protein XcpP [Pseudomonas putida]MDH0640803.1 protein XcpP [Pseudomonas sp. GD03860]